MHNIMARATAGQPLQWRPMQKLSREWVDLAGAGAMTCRRACLRQRTNSTPRCWLQRIGGLKNTEVNTVANSIECFDLARLQTT